MNEQAAVVPGRLLDLTRLVSRVGRGPLTGIDRVEMAYLEAMLARSEPAFGLVRGATRRLRSLLAGHVLLDRTGLKALHARLTGGQRWGQPDWIARLHLRQNVARRRALSDLRRLAVAQASTPGLGRMLRRHLPGGVTYLNVGHANLLPDSFGAIRQVPGARIEVLVHDVIPLDYPEFANPGVPEMFRRRMRLVGQMADRVIYNSHFSRRTTELHLARWGRVPPGCVAHLGVTPAPADTTTLEAVRPAGLEPGRAFLVVLGTIEPRKNHEFLLGLWEQLARESKSDTDLPALCIAGARGWCSADFFARLDGMALRGKHVFELPDLGDGAVSALLQQSRGLLFPSHVEGFGLPALEAAALGVPVLCNDLPVFREILGEYPVYAKVTDGYQWHREILALAGDAVPHYRGSRPPIPTWEAHFASVFGLAQQGLEKSIGRSD